MKEQKTILPPGGVAQFPTKRVDSVLRSCASILMTVFIWLSACHRGISPQNDIIGGQGKVDPRPIAAIHDIAFSGSDVCWVTTGSGDLLRSRDSGKTWDTTYGQSIGGFDHVCFLTDTQGWALRAGFKGAIAEYESASEALVVDVILRTNDGGTTWDKLAELTKGDVESTGGLLNITFVDESHGWLTGLFGVWRTTDGGRTWRWHSYPPASDLTSGAGHSCQFVGAETGWMNTEGGEVYKTSDGGRTWEVLETRQSAARGRGANLTTFLGRSLTGLMIGSDERLYHTDDGGESWYPDEAFDSQISPTFVDAVDQKNTWIIGSSHPESRTEDLESTPLLLHTSNGGQDWERVAAPEPGLTLLRVHFSDSKNGWVLALGASNDDEPVGKLFKTYDGGNDWRLVLSVGPTRWTPADHVAM